MYYVYYWFNLDKNCEVVYIGKGKGKRYLITERNNYFNNSYKKYNLVSHIMINNLTETEAFKIEKEHITFWKERKQANTNLHEGGYGGDVFKFFPEGKKKMIERDRIANSGKNNAMYNKNWQDYTTKEVIKNHRINCAIGQNKRYENVSEREKISKASKRNWNKPGVKETYHERNARKWHQFCLDGNYIQTFDSGGAVEKYLNIRGHMTLMKNMRLKKPYKKYYWIREEEKGVETIEKENNYFHLVE